jgi:hypothetical protein
MSLLDRDALITGLRALVGELQSRGRAANVRIVGGAAMALRYYERDTTRDIDVATNLDASELDEIARAIAARQGWSPDWLNASASIFVPSYDRPVEWVTVHDDAGVVIQVASPEAMLAMKLHANRPGRDDGDLRVLMAICDLTSLGELEALFEQYYPGDVLSDRAIRLVDAIVAEGVPARPAQMPGFDLGPSAPFEFGDRPVSSRDTAELDKQIAEERAAWD